MRFMVVAGLCEAGVSANRPGSETPATASGPGLETGVTGWRHAAGEADLRDADAGDHPADVAGGELAVEEAVEAVVGCGVMRPTHNRVTRPTHNGVMKTTQNSMAGEFVFHAVEEFSILPERERLGDLRVGAVGADQVARVADAGEFVAAAGFGRAGERRSAGQLDAG